MVVKSQTQATICQKCHLALGNGETPFRVDERTILSAEERALRTGDDDTILRFAELAEMGRRGKLHQKCANGIAHALRGETPPDLLVETLAWQTARELCHSPR